MAALDSETGVSGQKIRVLCVDDHPIVRKGIASLLANESDLKLVAEAASGREAVDLHRALQPDVTLMDLKLPDLDGVAATRMIREECPQARIIALTSYDGNQEIYRAVEAGARGYPLKEMVHTDVLRAIRVVHSGKRLIPPEVAERLTEYFPQIVLTNGARSTGAFVCREGNGDQRHRAPAGHRERHRQNARAEHL
jgi:DNA-binding NarL/FixJ family response regulator